MQLRTAAISLGADPEVLSKEQLDKIADCLQNDSFNIDLVARHLRQLIDRDGLQITSFSYGMDDIRIIGARYNRGTNPTIEQIKANTSYGNFIVKIWP